MIKFIFLGIVQGLTEFFPVSSSGHLAILQRVLGFSRDEVALAVILHLGTCLALLIFFFKDILKILRDLRMVLFVGVVTLITGLIGILGKKFFEGLFGNPRAVGAALIITAMVLLLTKLKKDNKRTQANLKDALILGITQGLAVAPGISRSGITISTLLFRGLNQETSFRLSFIASIPAVLGAFLLEAKGVDIALKSNFSGLLAGFIFSFLSGLLALAILKKIMQKAKLHYFAYYCMIAAVLTLFLVK